MLHQRKSRQVHLVEGGSGRQERHQMVFPTEACLNSIDLGENVSIPKIVLFACWSSEVVVSSSFFGAENGAQNIRAGKKIWSFSSRSSCPILNCSKVAFATNILLIVLLLFLTVGRSDAIPLNRWRILAFSSVSMLRPCASLASHGHKIQTSHRPVRAET